MRILSSALAIFVLALLPFVSVEGAGLVPCGGPDEPACQTCHAVDLMSNVINWLIAILGFIAGLIVIYAGVRLVTSVGNTSAMEAAKSLMTNMIIGYTIILAAWLIIDYGIRSLVDEAEFGPWNTLACVRQFDPEFNARIGYIDLPAPWSGGTINYQCTPLPNGQNNCTEQINQCLSDGGTTNTSAISQSSSVACVFSSGALRPPDLSAGGACDATLVGRYFPNEVGNAQCIIRGESTCGASNISTSDVMRGDGRAFSFGAMQINLTWHTLQNCSGYPSTLNCASAFSGRDYTAVVTNEALYQQCARAAQDLDCNLSNGRRIRDERARRQPNNPWGDWSTARGCGL